MAIPTVPFLVPNSYVFTSENEIVISNSTLLSFVLSERAHMMSRDMCGEDARKPLAFVGC